MTQVDNLLHVYCLARKGGAQWNAYAQRTLRRWVDPDRIADLVNWMLTQDLEPKHLRSHPDPSNNGLLKQLQLITTDPDDLFTKV